MKKSGFTLVEIMIVVAIVGILASMGVLAIMKSVNTSKTKNTQAELEMLSAAVLQLAWDTGRWPNGKPRNVGSSAEIEDLSQASCGLLANDGSFGNNWKGPYYDGSLEDPWDNNYFFDPDYTYKGNVIPVVGSYGPNGEGLNKYDSDDVLPEDPDLNG